MSGTRIALREPRWLFTTNGCPLAQPQQHRIAGARAQALLGGPQGFAGIAGGDQQEFLHVDLMAQKRGWIGQQRRCHQGDASLRAGQQRQQQGPFAVTRIGQQDLGQRLCRQPAAGQCRIQRGMSGGQPGRGRSRRAAAPQVRMIEEGGRWRHVSSKSRGPQRTQRPQRRASFLLSFALFASFAD